MPEDMPTPKKKFSKLKRNKWNGFRKKLKPAN